MLKVFNLRLFGETRNAHPKYNHKSMPESTAAVAGDNAKAALVQQAKNIKTHMKAELLRKELAHVSDLHAVSNPFVYKSELWTEREKKVVLLGGLFLLPFRIFCFIFIAVPVHLLLLLSITTIREDDKFDSEVPMSGWRRQVQLPIAYLMRVLVVLLGVQVETDGLPCDPSEAKTVVCAPHSSIYDSFYLVYAFRVPSCISKVENLRLPLFGVMFRAIQAITVDREDKSNRNLAFNALKRRCLDQRETRHLLVFPEGTCTNREALITFKRGAFSSGQPVQPVALEWPNNEFDVTWTAGGPSRVWLTLHLLCQPKINLKVHFLPVYHPSEEEQLDADLFARNVRQVIADRLKIGVTNHSTEDMFLAKEARRLKLNLGETLPFEFQELSSLFHISAADAKSLLKRYSSVYANRKKINGSEFANVLGIPFTPAVKELFDLLKEDEADAAEEEVDFKRLLIRVCQLSHALRSSEDLDASIELVWQALEVDSEQGIRVDELNKRLNGLFPHFTRSEGLFRHAKSSLIDFDAFKEALKRHPEMLFVAMESLAAVDNGESSLPKRRLSVLQQQAKE